MNISKRGMHLQAESKAELAKIPSYTVSSESATIGLESGEPLLFALDGMLRYAKAYRVQFESPLAEDGVLGDYWLDVVKGLRGLLNGEGAVAMETGRTTDSKDNRALEGIFWAAMKAAGFEGDAL